MKWRTTIAALLLAGCGSDTARHAVEQHGFTDVELTGHSLIGCSDEDSIAASYTFTAVSPNHQPVAGRICCGLLLRGCTVRF